MKDAVGQELKVGSQVAYVYRYGSTVRIERRLITHIDTVSEYLNLDNSRGRVLPHNVVRIEE